MAAEHNHPPRCCCRTYQVAPDDHDYEPRGGRIESEVCPACIQHGELTPADECPSCHTTAGHPHTDYCTLTKPLAGNIQVRDPQPTPPVDDLVGHLRDAVDRARERRNQP